MLSKKINKTVLRIFEEASLGIKPLLGFLELVLESSALTITNTLTHSETAPIAKSNNKHMVSDALASEHPSRTLLDTFTDQSSLSGIQLVNSAIPQLSILISQQESLYLLASFKHNTQLEACLNSEMFSELLPHIKQAILIANQISEQQTDAYSIHYVMHNHPWFKLSKPSLAVAKKESVEQPTLAHEPYQLMVEKEQLNILFDLTPSEIELSKLLLNGLSLQEIAERRGVSKQTTRKQLQAVLKKVQCDSQETLILTLLNGILSHIPSKQAYKMSEIGTSR